MSYATLERTIFKEFTDNFVLVPILGEDIVADSKTTPEFVRIYIEETNPPTQTCGGREVSSTHLRSRGLIFVETFTQNGRKKRTLDVLDAVKAVLELKLLIQKIRTDAARTRRRGTTTDGYWQVDLVIPYQYDYVQ